MPTEEELEQQITEHLDRERADEKILQNQDKKEKGGAEH